MDEKTEEQRKNAKKTVVEEKSDIQTEAPTGAHGNSSDNLVKKKKRQKIYSLLCFQG